MRKRSSIKTGLSIIVGLLALAVSAMNAVGQTAGQSNQPSTQPILRIETGMHTAITRRIGIDRENRYLVTASDDKTARLWELSSGKLLRVWRPPLGDGNEGKLFAVALSPDGRTVAAGGWTSPDGLNNNIYVFSRESGRMLRTIAGLPKVNHLSYSPDGSRLAAILGGQSGVRVFETSGYSQIFAESDYGTDSYGGDFDRAGRLVTSCYDGFLRLYERAPDNRALRLVTKRKIEGGNQPFSVSFSPDSSEIAVGFDDSTKVAVVSGRDLSLLFAPDNSGVDNGNLMSVSWSTDGRTLFAGGTYANNGLRPIRYWAEGGRGKWSEVAISSNGILQILLMRDGGVVFGTGEPSFGRVDARGNRALLVTAAIADYRDMLENFLLSADGTSIQFGYEPFGKSPGRFSLSARQLMTDITNNATDGFKPPIIAGLAVTDWKYTYAPKLNGLALKLDEYERSRSLAVAPDQSRFLLGADFSLRLFDRSSKELWKIAIPGVAWSVNISGDGRLAVAAFADGTIRWFRMADGKELLAFFPHKDRKRWVAWTPSGYYDASPGAEELIGWHVNNGRDAAADFFPVGQFRDTYYRPDVIAGVLQTGDEARALDLANNEAGRKKQQASIAQQLPPVVEIISPSDDSEVSTTQIAVRFRVRTPSGEPVTNVRALLDGRPVGARDLVMKPVSSDVRELQVTVQARDSTVSVIAENRFSASVPASVRLRWVARGPRVNQPDSSAAANAVIKPKLYVLAVGVSRYANEGFNLKYADKDARDFVGAMLAQKGFLYRDVTVYRDKALVNAEATKDEILDGLDWIRKQTTSIDVAMIFFAGHGVNDQNNYYFFCPHNIDPERLLRTGVAFSDIKNVLSAIAGKALFFVDTCHSGNSIGMAGRRGPLDINIVINELSSAQNGVIVFSASTSSESSYERDEWNNGAFTKSLVEGINGAADLLNKGRITYTMLNVYVAERVKELTKGQQHPTMISPNTVPDFPIAVKK